MVMGKKKDNSVEENISFDDGNATIIFLQPNAGYYEFSLYSNEWVDFYWNQGVNILLWNYRGFGSQKGVPSSQVTFNNQALRIQNLKTVISDAEAIVDYLRTKEKIGLLGAHGQSLGGMVACFLASSKNLDFLCCDRTFSCLSDVAQYSMPKFFKVIFRLITSNDKWSAVNYVKSSCYKILTYDLKDNIIPFMSSLKIGVTKQIAQNLLCKNENENYHQEFNESFIKNLKGFCKKTWKQDPTIQEAVKCFLMSEGDQKTLYNSLLRIVSLVRLALQKDKKKEKDSQLNGNLLQKANDNRTTKGGGSSFLQKQSTSDVNSTLDYGSVLNGSMLLDGIKEEESKSHGSASLRQSYSSDCSDFYSSLSPQNNQFKELEIHKDLEKQQNATQKKLASNGYIQLWRDQFKQNEQFTKFFKSLFSLLDSYDAGGLTIIDVFCLFPPTKSFYIFQLFLLNLSIWGSYLPLNQVIKKNLVGSLPQKYAFAKTREMIRKLEKIVLSSRQITEIPDDFLSNIIADLSVITEKLSILRNKLAFCYQTGSDKLLDSMSQFNAKKYYSVVKELSGLNDKDIQSNVDKFQNGIHLKDPSSDKKDENINLKIEEIEMLAKDVTQQKVLCTNEQGPIVSQTISGNHTPERKKKQKIGEEGEIKIYQNLKEDPQSTQPIEQIELSKVVGNLLPLSCGHNGYLSDFERQLFLFHLKNSGFLKEG